MSLHPCGGHSCGRGGPVALHPCGGHSCGRGGPVALHPRDAEGQRTHPGEQKPRACRCGRGNLQRRRGPRGAEAVGGAAARACAREQGRGCGMPRPPVVAHRRATLSPGDARHERGDRAAGRTAVS